MSKEQFRALQERMAGDLAFQASLKSAGDVESALQIAREAGFDVNQDDVSEYLANQEQALADDQVKDLSGGGWREDAWRTNNFAPNWP